MIIFIKNITIEGPETLGDFFYRKGFKSETIDLSCGEKLPPDFSQVYAVVCLGGPMNFYEEDKYAFLKEEDIFIKRILSEEVPFLGICLGAQLLAKACGAKVVKSPEKEVGFFNVSLTEEGRRDPIFQGIDESFDVYQWHEDMFELPKDAQLLASSERCPYQAFKAGTCAYGFQFHIEITDKSIIEWSEAYLNGDDLHAREQKNIMLEDYKIKKEILNNSANRVYNNFLQILRGREEKC
jgi:GMP synthase-like glutamine amidotransferase